MKHIFRTFMFEYVVAPLLLIIFVLPLSLSRFFLLFGDHPNGALSQVGITAFDIKRAKSNWEFYGS